MRGNEVSAGGPSLRAFAALAILKVNWDDHRDYMANFRPLVGHCLRESRATAVSVGEAQDQVQNTFALRIPQGALKTILGRAAREDLVTREHNVYRPNVEALEKLNLAPARQSVLRRRSSPHRPRRVGRREPVRP